MTGEAASDVAAWADSAAAAAVFAVAPAVVGGVVVRARYGAPGASWVAHLRSLLNPDMALHRIPPNVSAEQLLGGLDLVATLERGDVIMERGLLARADGGIAILPMAERLGALAAAHIADALERRDVTSGYASCAVRESVKLGCIALDEGIEDDEHVPDVLLERLALRVDLGACGDSVEWSGLYDRESVMSAAAFLPQVRIPGRIVKALCHAARVLGIDTLRAPIAAVRVARILAALDLRRTVTAEDAAFAARLALAWRATQIPSSDEPSEPSEPEEEQAENSADEDSTSPTPEETRGLEDRVLDAARAAIPPDVLAACAAQRARRGAAGGRRGATRSGTRGRPAGVKRGEPTHGARLSVLDTLRAAAPWQASRGRSGPRVIVHRDDLRIVRSKHRARTTIIFAVDASGSQAVNRLAEVKGAVELLLADCYIQRNRVALISFRGRGAEQLLEPTRSLVRAKRSLAALPGGGGTPLALGIAAAALLADTCRRAGDTPFVVVMTDGRANVARDGSGGRDAAQRDAQRAAESLGASGCAAVIVDTGRQPSAQASALAHAMRARYVALPYATSAGLSHAIQRMSPAAHA